MFLNERNVEKRKAVRLTLQSENQKKVTLEVFAEVNHQEC